MLEANWTKSSFSGQFGCVEARQIGDTIQVRDSKVRNGLILNFNKQEWRAFTQGVANGEFKI